MQAYNLLLPVSIFCRIRALAQLLVPLEELQIHFGLNPKFDSRISMKLYPHVFHLPLSGVPLYRKILLRRLLATSFSLACIVWLNLTLVSARSKSILARSCHNVLLAQEFPGGLPGVDPQSLVEGPGFTINVDAFNSKRRIDIANDSRKLLSLAIAVKSELDKAPGRTLSDETLRKLKQIEKLAHAVKEKMKMDPGFQ
jgi:hypothetical protein